jgi:hypothetical protein
MFIGENTPLKGGKLLLVPICGFMLYACDMGGEVFCERTELVRSEANRPVTLA